jgi:wyosine [tRNA(Phe)-imidazoG37] synthetase (radical SAM superfamily)
MQDSSQPDNPLFEAHPRTFAANRYVYPVLSRRAGGISIGVNLNLDRSCNFRCVYCQVDRATPAGKGGQAPRRTKGASPPFPQSGPVDLDRLAEELDRMVVLVVSGRIFEGPQFRGTPPALRRLNDIALSGDGEPTLSANFDQAVEVCAEVRRRHGLDGLKLVLLTNAGALDQPRVRRALETLDRNGGEIWAKLDAGAEYYYARVNRSAVPWQRILDNLREAAIRRPIVVQSLFMRIRGEREKGDSPHLCEAPCGRAPTEGWSRQMGTVPFFPPTAAELAAYCSRLEEILAAGGRIKLVQVHTIARPPAEAWVSALADAEVDAIAELVRHRTGLPVAAFYGSS